MEDVKKYGGCDCYMNHISFKCFHCNLSKEQLPFYHASGCNKLGTLHMSKSFVSGGLKALRHLQDHRYGAIMNEISCWWWQDEGVISDGE